MNTPGYIFLLIIIAAVASQQVTAQKDTTLRKEVEVVKAYKPTISEANKINDIPVIKDDEFKKPKFEYDINSKPVFSAFSVSTLKAASIEGKPEETPGLGLVKAGFGNYNKPYGELFFNSRQTKSTFFGMHFKHLSSHGKVKLPGGDKVKAPYSDNFAGMFLKYNKGNSLLSLNLGFDHDGFRYYGYPVDSVHKDLLNSLPVNNNYFGKKQAFSKGTFNLNLVNIKPDPNVLTAGFNFTYSYFGTKTGQREHLGEFTGNIRKPMNDLTGLLDLSATFYKASDIDPFRTKGKGYRQQLWLSGKPAVVLGKDIANVTAGINLWLVFDNIDAMKIRMAPNLRFNFTPVKEIITIYTGVDGNYIHNNYSRIAYENPFVNPLHDVKNTMQRFRAFGGFDGKLSSKTNFKLSVEYSQHKNQPFYYLYAYSSNPQIIKKIVQNDFKLLYDSLNILKFNAEIYHTATEKLDLLISANYYKYKTGRQRFAWNMPEFDAKLSVGYKITDQLTVSSDVYLIGKRHALLIEAIGNGEPISLETLMLLSSAQFKSYVLDTVFDMNFMAQYKVNQKFSLFARLNNFGFQSYQRWFGYPVQGFNFLGGLSYAF